MRERNAQSKRKLRIFIGAVVVATIYFFAGQRMVIKTRQLDVHTGAIRTETRGYWGGYSYETKNPWQEAELRNLFPDAEAPRWLPIRRFEQRVLPDLSSSARRKAWKDPGILGEVGSVSTFITLNLSQVLKPPIYPMPHGAI